MDANNLVPISSLEPNSHKYHKANGNKEEKKVEKVVSGEVVTRRRPLGKKIAETFLADDVEKVKGYVFFDVVVPTIKNLIVDIISDSVEMILLGTTRGGRRRTGGLNERASYTAYYKSGTGNNRRNDASDRNSRPDYRDIVLSSRNEAEEVLSNLVDLTTDYEAASVADLYDLVGISRTANFTDEKWGWTDLGKASVRRVRDGYLLDLPKAEPLD